MFSKKSLPITIAFILILALGTMGMAYGVWTETLFINGDIKAGNFDVVFTAVETTHSDGGLSTCTSVKSTDNHTLTITMDNVYPGFSCKVYANVMNTGTIPANLTGFIDTTTPGLAVDGVGNTTLVLPAGAELPDGFTLEYFAPADIAEGAHIEFHYTIPAIQAVP